MPIEVRELIIRAEVAPPAQSNSPGGADTAAGGGDDRRALIEDCVEQVLAILRDKEER